MGLLSIRIGQLFDALFWGIPITLKLLRKDPKTVYYILHTGLGDYCVSLGYLDSYKTHHKIDHVTIVGMKGKEEVCGFFSGYENMLMLPKHQYYGLVYIASLPLLRRIHLHNRRIENVSYTLHMNKSLLYSNPALHVETCTKIILKIPEGSEMFLPEIPDVDISAITKSYSLRKGRTVILNPFTSGIGVQKLDDEFYQMLTEALKIKGFKVVTILGNTSQKAVKGTEGIQTSLAEAWHLAKWCGWVIGTRSGFFDVIQHSGCRVIAIYDSSYRQREFFSLTRDSGTGRIFEYTYHGSAKDMADLVLRQVLSDDSL